MAVAEGALKVAALAVSGAFHTPLTQTAQDNLKQASHKSAIPLCCVCTAGAQSLQSTGAVKLQVAKERLYQMHVAGLVCLFRRLPCTTLARG